MAEPARLAHYPLLRSGKVRDLYDAGEHLLLVATDRLSAFDVILPTPIPGKGVLLTQIAAFWFAKTAHLCPNHLVATNISGLDLDDDESRELAGRTMICRKADRIDIECVVRGYLAGSGFREYADSGTLAGESLPGGLRLGDALPEPRFTPAIKNDEGHDENISRARLREIVGEDLAKRLEETSFAIYELASGIAAEAGFILADTKFEFGWIDGELTLIDEVLTPDSSRYWDAASRVPGEEPPSFDKQIIRDWLASPASGWDRAAETPPPPLPDDVVEHTRARYVEVFERLTGRTADFVRDPRR